MLDQLTFVFSDMYIPSDFIDEVDKLLFDFLWSEGKKPKVKSHVLTNNISLGGLKLVTFRNTTKLLKTIWVERLFPSISTKYKNKWAHIADEMIGITNKKLLLMISKQSFEDLKFPPWCSTFYEQVLECWFNFFPKGPDTY